MLTNGEWLHVLWGIHNMEYRGFVKNKEIPVMHVGERNTKCRKALSIHFLLSVQCKIHVYVFIGPVSHYPLHSVSEII